MAIQDDTYTEAEAKAALKAAGYDVDCDRACCDWRHIPNSEVLRVVKLHRAKKGNS